MPTVPTTTPDRQRELAGAPDDEVGLDDDGTFDRLVERLSRQSVDKHYAAYEDIPWDDPEFAVDPTDRRWETVVSPGLRDTAWFRALPADERARLGCYLAANFAKIGLQFENILKRGLFEFAFALPNNDVTFRYAYHEAIEEAQHALMFQELVNRTGFDIPGLPPHLQRGSRRIVSLGRVFPELFFVFVLGGEDPIDHVQREALRRDEPLPPILERIVRIHVTEEARHLSFARHYLKRNVPRLGAGRRLVLSVATPVVLGVMAQLMMRPSRDLIRRFAIPDDVVRAAYADNPAHAQRTRDSLRKVRRLSEEIGLLNPVSRRLWRAFGIWE